MARKLTKAQQQERLEATTMLRAILKPGDTVYAIVRSVSASGMSRKMSFFAVDRDAKERPLISLTSRIGAALGWNVSDYHGHWAITVGGCGMDMVFHVVSTLASVLFPIDGGDYPLKGDGPETVRDRARCYWLNSEQL